MSDPSLWSYPSFPFVFIFHFLSPFLRFVILPGGFGSLQKWFPLAVALVHGREYRVYSVLHIDKLHHPLLLTLFPFLFPLFLIWKGRSRGGFAFELT